MKERTGCLTLLWTAVMPRPVLRSYRSHIKKLIKFSSLMFCCTSVVLACCTILFPYRSSRRNAANAASLFSFAFEKRQ
jgi:hypothetical protein